MVKKKLLYNSLNEITNGFLRDFYKNFNKLYLGNIKILIFKREDKSIFSEPLISLGGWVPDYKEYDFLLIIPPLGSFNLNNIDEKKYHLFNIVIEKNNKGEISIGLI
jgi:hypothetical protein